MAKKTRISDKDARLSRLLSASKRKGPSALIDRFSKVDMDLIVSAVDAFLADPAPYSIQSLANALASELGQPISRNALQEMIQRRRDEKSR